jgi:hypothetical protein
MGGKRTCLAAVLGRIVTAALAGSLCLAVSCARFGGYPDWRETDGGRPTIVLLYYPYGPALSRDVTAPVPDYLGWPDERIERDFSRITGCGIDVVLLAVPEDAATVEGLRIRYEDFFALRARQEGWPPLAVWIGAPALSGAKAGTAEGRTAFINWLVACFQRHPQIFWQENGRAFAVLAPTQKVWPVYHPALVFRHTAEEGRQWSWKPVPAGTMGVGNSEEALTVFAGYRDSEGRWQLPRRKGRTLRRGIRQAALLQPHYICIASWNNFVDGSFIEPNMLDGNRLLDALTHELERMTRQDEKPVDHSPAL